MNPAKNSYESVRAKRSKSMDEDSSQLGRGDFGKICGLEANGQIITDNKASPLVVKHPEERDIEVTLSAAP